MCFCGTCSATAVWAHTSLSHLTFPYLDCYYPSQLHAVHTFCPLASVLGTAAWLVSNRRHQLYWVLLRLGTNREASARPRFFALTCKQFSATTR